jgi:hypothetical protein
MCKKQFKVGASIANAGIMTIGSGAVAGVLPCTTTNNTESYGFALDTATYSTTQGDAEGLVTCDISGDLVIRALASGGATEGTALATCTNTSASSGGTTVTATGVQANDMDGGIAWCISGNNVGQNRAITTHTGSTSFVVTVPFPHPIAVGDVFLMVPWAAGGDGSGSGMDGCKTVQTSTLFTQADATIASGTGCTVAVVELELNGASDSYVLFVNMENIWQVATL